MVKNNDKIVIEWEVETYNYTKEKKEELKKIASKKYEVPYHNVRIEPKIINKENKDTLSISSVIENIQKPEFQKELIKEYIKLNKVEDIDFEEISRIDDIINSMVDFEEVSKFKTYKFKYAKWKNFLSYGDNNYINFDDLNGLVLVSGGKGNGNQNGKTTLAINLIKFGLFGKTDKSNKLEGVFNTFLPEETECMVEVCIEVEGLGEYVIRRTLTRPELKKRTSKSKVTQKIEYFKVINGVYEDLKNENAETNVDTNNLIKEIIGSVEDYELIISANARSLDNILSMGQSDRSRFFSRWLGLETIEEKEVKAKEYYKKNIQSNFITQSYSKTEILTDIEDIDNVIEATNEEVKELEALKEKLSLDIENKEKEKEKLYKSFKAISEESKDIRPQSIENEINNIKNKGKETKDIYLSKQKRYNEIKDVLFDEEQYNTNEVSIKTFEKNINNINVENAEIKTNIKHLQNEKTKIEELSSNSICPVCKEKIDKAHQGTFISEINDKIQTEIKRGVENKNKIENFQTEIEKLKLIQNDLLEKKRLSEESSKLKIELELIKFNLTNLKKELDEKEQKLKVYKENISNIEFNEKLNVQITNIVGLINSLKYEFNNKINLIADKRNQIKNYENNKKGLLEIIEKIDAETKIIRNWDFYKELLGKEGIIKIVMRKALPTLNAEIARLLTDIVDFELRVEIDDNNNLVINLYKDNVEIDIKSASGLESVFSAMAIRNSLSKISNIPTANFLVYDEIVNGVAQNNYDNLKELFNRILVDYQFILHIAHNEMLVDIHDSIIRVEKEDNISKLLLE